MATQIKQEVHEQETGRANQPCWMALISFHAGFRSFFLIRLFFNDTPSSAEVPRRVGNAPGGAVFFPDLLNSIL